MNTKPVFLIVVLAVLLFAVVGLAAFVGMMPQELPPPATPAAAATDAAPAVIPTVTFTPSRTPTGTLGPAEAHAASKTEVYTGDNITAEVVGGLRQGQQVKLLGVNSLKSWWFIEFTDLQADEVRRGWAANTALTIAGDTSAIPIVTVDSANQLP